MRAAAALVAVCLGATAQVRFLPRGGASTAVADANGTVCVGGGLNGRAFVGSIGGGGTRVLFTLDEENSGVPTLALGADGSVFAAGNRWDGSTQHAFVLKLDAAGKLQYRADIPGYSTTAMSVAVNSNGEALIGGQLYDPTGAFVPTGSVGADDKGNGFLVKLDPTGTKRLVALRGIGAGVVAFDRSGDLYIAGVDWINSGFPTTPGAFQSKHGFQMCGGTGFLAIPCGYQYVAKISGDGARLIYSTFVTGGTGASPAAITLDAEGNALVAGTTSSNDYPVTASAYQTEYRVTNRPPVVPSPHGYVIAPPNTGYLTKVNRDGTGLVWSTFFSGTGSDSISGLVVLADGRMVLSGLSGSRDLPGAQSVPDACAPGLALEVPFVAEFSAEASRLSASRFVFGLDPGGRPQVAMTADGQPVVAAGETTTVVDLAASTGLTCTMDSADYARVARAAPGQLISVLGDELDGATVAVDGVPAALLYTSREQINLRVPVEVDGRDVVEVAVTTANGILLTRPMRVVPRAPSAFLDMQQAERVSHYLTCAGATFGPADPPVARNEDGSLNSCASPALPGSTITLFLNGLGTAAPTASLRYPQAGTVVALEPDPDSPAGVWRLLIRLPNVAITETIAPLIDGEPLRDAPLAIWMAGRN